MVGIQKVTPEGVFDDYYSYGDVLTTNIFAMFSGLILDFGIVGSLLFMLMAGYLLRWAFHAMLWNAKPVFTVAAFIFGIGFLYSSFAISMLQWGNIYLTFALLWVVPHTNEWITRAAGPRVALP